MFNVSLLVCVFSALEVSFYFLYLHKVCFIKFLYFIPKLRDIIAWDRVKQTITKPNWILFNI